MSERPVEEGNEIGMTETDRVSLFVRYCPSCGLLHAQDVDHLSFLDLDLLRVA